jgi:Flp pilus assembly protein TadG
MMTGRSFAKDQFGATAAEFAMVLPLALLFLFGIIDVGRLMWTWNQAEKATQFGARYAVSTDMVASGLASYKFATDGGLLQGEPVPSSSFPGMTCAATQTGVAPTIVTTVVCTCKATCGFPTTTKAAAFTNIVSRMSLIKPDIRVPNVTIDYDYSGLGFAGDPNGPDVAPLVTVKLRNLKFAPISLFNSVAVNLPDFSYSLTMEDGAGTVSN